MNAAFQPRKYTTYERDAHNRDDAMHRQYSGWYARFSQPDPSGGSYDLTDPQSFNRYAYTNNDPVNFTDPAGLNLCPAEFGHCGGGTIDPDGQPLLPGFNYSYHWTGEGFRAAGQHRESYGGVFSPAGDDSGGRLQHPLVPDKRLVGPCEGRRGADLKYDEPRKKPDDDGAKTAREHITNRHMKQLGKHVGNKSVYEFGALNRASDGTKMAIVAGLNAATFNAGLPLPQVQSDGSLRYLFVLDFNIFSPALLSPYTGGQAIVGRVYTKTIKGKMTGMNSLVFEGDCQTVVTSFPSM